MGGFMKDHNLAIVGLGRVGTAFLQQLLDKQDERIGIRCVIEPDDTAGKLLARENGIEIVDVDELVEMGMSIDVVFDFTGDVAFRPMLEGKLASVHNSHTSVCNSNIARFIWALMSDDCLPEVHGSKYQALADMLLERGMEGDLPSVKASQES